MDNFTAWIYMHQKLKEKIEVTVILGTTFAYGWKGCLYNGRLVAVICALYYFI